MSFIKIIPYTSILLLGQICALEVYPAFVKLDQQSATLVLS